MLLRNVELSFFEALSCFFRLNISSRKSSWDLKSWYLVTFFLALLRVSRLLGLWKLGKVGRFSCNKSMEVVAAFRPSKSEWKVLDVARRWQTRWYSVVPTDVFFFQLVRYVSNLLFPLLIVSFVFHRPLPLPLQWAACPMLLLPLFASPLPLLLASSCSPLPSFDAPCF